MHRSRITALPGALLVLGLILTACGNGGAATSAPADDDGGAATETAAPTDDAAADGDTVSLAGGAFSPTSLTVAAGTTVTFTDTGGHTVTEGSNGTAVDDPIVDETGGADIEVTFDEPGTYSITCKIHPNMNMTVRVEG